MQLVCFRLACVYVCCTYGLLMLTAIHIHWELDMASVCTREVVAAAEGAAVIPLPPHCLQASPVCPAAVPAVVLAASITASQMYLLSEPPPYYYIQLSKARSCWAGPLLL